jgi:hypothetical protein
MTCGNFGWLSERFSHGMSVNDEMYDKLSRKKTYTEKEKTNE